MGSTFKVIDNQLRAEWVRLLADESGQDLIEYALVAALVALAVVASLKSLGTKIGAAFTTVGTTLTSNT